MTETLTVHFHWHRRGPVHLLFAGDLKMGGVQAYEAGGTWFAWTAVVGCRLSGGYHPTFEAAQAALVESVTAALIAEGRR